MSEKVVIGNATLYRGDCLEILPTLADWVEDWLQTMSADEETILNLRAIEQALRTAANWQSQCALNLHKLKYTEAERDALQARIDAAPGPELTWGDAEIQVVSYTHWWHTQGPGANK